MQSQRNSRKSRYTRKSVPPNAKIQDGSSASIVRSLLRWRRSDFRRFFPFYFSLIILVESLRYRLDCDVHYSRATWRKFVWIYFIRIFCRTNARKSPLTPVKQASMSAHLILPFRYGAYPSRNYSLEDVTP